MHARVNPDAATSVGAESPVPGDYQLISGGLSGGWLSWFGRLGLGVHGDLGVGLYSSPMDPESYLNTIPVNLIYFEGDPLDALKRVGPWAELEGQLRLALVPDGPSVGLGVGIYVPAWASLLSVPVTVDLEVPF